MSVDLPEWFCPKKRETNAAAGILPSGSMWRPVGECPTVEAGWPSRLPLHTVPETTCRGNIKGEAATTNSLSSHCTAIFFFFHPDTQYLWVQTCERFDLWLCPDLICSHFLAGFLWPVCYLQEGFDSLCWMDWAKTDQDRRIRLLKSACCFFLNQF